MARLQFEENDSNCSQVNYGHFPPKKEKNENDLKNKLQTKMKIGICIGFLTEGIRVIIQALFSISLVTFT